MKHNILSEESKNEIREKYKNTIMSQAELSELYMVSIRTIYNIVKAGKNGDEKKEKVNITKKTKSQTKIVKQKGGNTKINSKVCEVDEESLSEEYLDSILEKFGQ